MASVDFAAQPSVLWDFVCRSYARPGVAEACLHVQDEHGVDVLLLLSAAWLATQGQRLTPERLTELKSCCQPRREQLIEPLRGMRRAQRPGNDHSAEQQALYEALKAAEMAAERRQVLALETLMQRWPVDGRSGVLLLDNLRMTASEGALPTLKQLSALLAE